MLVEFGRKVRWAIDVKDWSGWNEERLEQVNDRSDCQETWVVFPDEREEVLRVTEMRESIELRCGYRSILAADLFATWKRAVDYAQISTELICNQLYNYPKLVEWLGDRPFTGRSLLERKRQKQLVDTLDGFVRNPLDRRHGGQLTDIALTALTADNPKLVLDEIHNWWMEWTRSQGLSVSQNMDDREIDRQIYLAIVVVILNDRLGFLVDRLHEIMQSRLVDLHDVSKILVYRPPKDFLPAIPASPVGNILGFRYTRDRNPQKGGKLQYFRYVGVGRYLLLNFPHLYEMEKYRGPHTILISGTSYVPGSPAYHLKVQPTVLLESAKSSNGMAGDVGIAQSQFFFKPQYQSDGNAIAISGLPLPQRQTAVSNMVDSICHAPGRAANFLDSIFQDLENNSQSDSDRWSDRSRLLVLGNSYDEAELLHSKLVSRYRLFSDPNAIVHLIRDSDPEEDRTIHRGQVQTLRDTPTRILTAPLMALERGHNILNQNNKAAFGAAVFVNRPMPVPDDWQLTVQQLNAWALDNAESKALYQELKTANLKNMDALFYRAAIREMNALNCRAGSFKQLTRRERSVLCSSR